jgi:hypothetical protein
VADAKRRTRRGALVGAAAAVLLALAAGPAAGTVVDRGHYTDTFAASFVDCGGITFDEVITFTGQFRIQATKDPEAFLVRDTFKFRDVITNRATGKWFVLRGIVNFHEIKYRHIGGTLYEFTANESGQPFVLEDSSGRVVVRDRGNIRRVGVFDTLGDAEPGADFITELSVSVRGPHPAFDDPAQFCNAAVALTA